MSKTGRNEPCPCGSGKKFKRCHGPAAESDKSGRVLMIVVGLGMLAAVAAGLASFTTERSTVRVWDPAHGHYHDASGTQVP
jgi:hypothetical protein